MKYLFIMMAGLISLHGFAGCSKSGNDDPGTNPAPSNIVINAIVSNDGSGQVDFTVTAINANTYAFEFGDGVIRDEPTGKVSHRYTTVGTLGYTVKVTARNAAGNTASASKDITVTVSQQSMTLLWADEFDKDGAPDPTKWGYDIGTGSNGWGNAELQFYTNRSQNVIVQNGVLKINALRENFSGSAFTSTRLLSKGKFEFKFGRVEFRAKVPAGVGTWPAVWMLGADISSVGWPACGEVDMLEHRGSDLNRIVAALHYPGRSGSNPNSNTTMVPTASTAFHVYRFDWTATSLQFYVDGNLFHSVVNTNTMPYNKDFFLLINMAMGGNFGGAVDPAFNSATFEVDYIRVYR